MQTPNFTDLLKQDLAQQVCVTLQSDYDKFKRKVDDLIKVNLKNEQEKLKSLVEALNMDLVFYRRVFLPYFFLSDILLSHILKLDQLIGGEYSVTFSTKQFEGIQTLICCADLTRTPNRDRPWQLSPSALNNYKKNPPAVLKAVKSYLGQAHNLLPNVQGYPDFIFWLQEGDREIILDDTKIQRSIRGWFYEYKRGDVELPVNNELLPIIQDVVKAVDKFLSQDLPEEAVEKETVSSMDCQILDKFLCCNTLWAKLSCLAEASSTLAKKSYGVELKARKLEHKKELNEQELQEIFNDYITNLEKVTKAEPVALNLATVQQNATVLANMLGLHTI